MDKQVIKTVIDLINYLGLIAKQLHKGHLSDKEARGRLVIRLEETKNQLIKDGIENVDD